MIVDDWPKKYSIKWRSKCVHYTIFSVIRDENNNIIFKLNWSNPSRHSIDSTFEDKYRSLQDTDEETGTSSTTVLTDMNMFLNYTNFCIPKNYSRLGTNEPSRSIFTRLEHIITPATNQYILTIYIFVIVNKNKNNRDSN